MTEKSYSQLGTEIADKITKLRGIQLSAVAVRQDLDALLKQRAALEAELGLGSATPAKRPYRRSTSSTAAPDGRLTREQAAEVRQWWLANAERIGVPYRKAGLIGDKVKEAFANK